MRELEPPKLAQQPHNHIPGLPLSPIANRHQWIAAGAAAAYFMLWMTVISQWFTWFGLNAPRPLLLFGTGYPFVDGALYVFQVFAVFIAVSYAFIARRMAHIHRGRIPCGGCQYDLQNMPDEPAPCPECGRVFASLQHARVHYAGPAPKNIFAPTIPARDTRVRLAMLACPPIAIAIDLFRAHRVDWTISLAELTVIWIAPLALVTLALYECHIARRTRQFEALPITPCPSCAFPLPPGDPTWCPRCKHTTTHAEAREAWQASHPKRWWRQQLKRNQAR